MQKNFQVVLDFLVDLKSDKSKVEKLAKDVENILSNINPDIDFNSSEAKQGIKQLVQFLQEAENGAEDLEKTLTALDVDLNTDEAKKALDDIESALKDIDNIDLSDIEKAFQELEQSGIDKNLAEIDKALENLDADKFNQEVEKLADSFCQAKQETEQLISKQKLALQALKNSGKQGSEAYNKLEQEIAQAEKKLKSMGMTAQATGKSFGEKMATFGLAVQGVQQITDAFERFIGPYKEFDKQLRNIGTLGVKNFEEFRDKAIELASGVPDTVAGVTEGIYNAISAGAIKVTNGIADVAGGMGFVEQASKLAVAGLTDTNAAIKSLAANLNAYGESMDQAERYSDILFNTVNNGVTTIPELNASLSNVIPTAASFGVSFEQVTAAIATMTQQGVPTAQATTQIRAALVELAKPGATLAPIMEKAGVSLDSLQKDGLQVSLEKLGQAMSETGLRANQVFSSVEAAGAALALSGDNAEKFADVLSTYTTDAIGSTQRAFDIANEGIGVKVQGVLNKIEAGFFKFFGAVGDGFTQMLALSNQIAPMVMTFGQIGNIIPADKIKSQLSGISGQFTSLFKNANKTGGILKGISAQMQSSGGILAKLGPMITNPWVLGTAAAVAGITLFLTKTEKGQQILERWGDSAEELWNRAQPAIQGFLDMGEEVVGYLIKYGELIFEMLIAPVEIAISYVTTIIETFLSLIGVSNESAGTFQNLGDVLKLIGNYFETAAKGVQIMIYAVRTAKDYVIGFVEAIPELFSVLMDYAQYYLNPVNWISGDEEFENELSNRLNKAISGAMVKANSTIADSKMDYALQNAMELKDDLDKNKKVDELVAKFQSAKTEIQKNNIAKELAKEVPNAVNGYKEIIDENGKVVQAIDLNIDKVKEFTKANEESYSNKLKSEQDAFAVALKEKAELYQKVSLEAENLANQIVEGSKKGEDVSDIKLKYSKLTQELKSQTLEMAKSLEDGAKIDIEFENIKLPDKVEQQFSKQLYQLRNKAEDIVDVQEKSKKEAEAQAAAVDKLAEAWDNATSNVEKNLKSQLSAANEIYKQLQNKALSEDERKELKEQYREAIRNLKDQAKEKKNLDRIDELNQIRAGLIVRQGKTALEIAKEQADIKTKSLDLEMQNYEYVQKKKLLAEERKADDYDDLLINQKQLETIKNQRAAWIEVLKAKKLISDVNSNSEIIFQAKVKEADKTEIKSVIQDFNEKILEEQAKIQELKLKLKADDLDMQDKLKELEQKKIDWEISIGIKNEDIYEGVVEEYRSKLSGLRDAIESGNNEIVELNRQMNEELAQVSGENAEQEMERIRIQYGLKVRELRSQNLKLQNEEFETMQAIRDFEERIYQSRLDELKKFEEGRIKEIENKYQKEEELINRFNEIYSSAGEKKISSDKDDALKKIEIDEKAKIAELEKRRNMEAISAEEFEKRKAEIEESGRKKRAEKEKEYAKQQTNLESQRNGIELELQRRKDEENLTLQKQSLLDQLALLAEKAKAFDEAGKPIFDSKADREAYESLSSQLQDTESLLSQKADSIGVLVGGLQTTVTDSLTNLFAADPDAAAENWRKFFGQLAGMLQAKASAFVLDLILSPGTMEYLSALPFPANVVSIPVITAVVNAAVKAVTDPVISSILSFSSGGRIDEPTFALIGDATTLGGRNREWIFRDDQLIATVQMASAGANAQLLYEIRSLKAILAGQELKTTLKGSDIDIALRRRLNMRNKRGR